MNRIERVWTKEQIENYYLGIRYSDYPNIFWEKIQLQLTNCKTLIDIGSGPGAFAIKAAEYGLDVQAVDINKEHLIALDCYMKKFNLKGIKLINGEWPNVDVKKSDVSICGYSLGGEIGTPNGIRKVLEITNRIAFFIISYNKEQTDFSSKELYQKVGINPPQFGRSFKETLEIFGEQLNEEITFDIIENDFGMPIENMNSIPYYSEYLSEKLGIRDIDAVEKHLRQIIIIKNGGLWIPNYRKSVMLIWKRKQCFNSNVNN